MAWPSRRHPVLRALALLLVWMLAPAAWAEGAEPFVSPLAPLDTSNPRATYESLIAQSQAIDAALTAYRAAPSLAGQRELDAELGRVESLFDLSQTAPAARPQVASDSFGLLKDILIRLPPFQPDALPGGPDAPSWVRLPGTEIEIVRVGDGSGPGIFRISADSVARLAGFHQRIASYPTLRPSPFPSWHREQLLLTGPLVPGFLASGIPAPLQVIVLGTPLWKIAASLVLGTLAAGAALLWGRSAAARARQSGKLGAALWRLTIPVGLGLLVRLLDLYLRSQVNLTGAFATGMLALLLALGYLCLAWAVRVVCTMVTEVLIASPAIVEYSYDAHLLRLIGRVAGLLGAAAVLVFGANEIGLPLLGIVTGLGVGGFALALAAQSTVENLFGGVSLFADKPFRVGDFIIFSGGAGEVESIGPRSTRIRALDGMLITVPNADLAKMQVTNKTTRNATLFRHVVQLRRETAPERLVWFDAELTAYLRDHAKVDQVELPPRVRLVGFGDSSLDVEVRADVLESDEDAYFAVQEELLLTILHLLHQGGLALALPSQIAYEANEPGLVSADR
ncbi:MAG: mechanosensitive ion channel family protein [Amaricoccus sp.]